MAYALHQQGYIDIKAISIKFCSARGDAAQIAQCNQDVVDVKKKWAPEIRSAPGTIWDKESIKSRTPQTAGSWATRGRSRMYSGFHP